MKYTKVYDSVYETMLLGYECDTCFIARDCHTTWTGNEVLEGYSVETSRYSGKRLFYAGTLREAKKFAETMEV